TTIYKYNLLNYLLETIRTLVGLVDGGDFVVKLQLIPTFGIICRIINNKPTFINNS
ncbi:hypothetical protein GE21DRAFT_1223850, partial [Neurospora crassa]